MASQPTLVNNTNSLVDSDFFLVLTKSSENFPFLSTFFFCEKRGLETLIKMAFDCISEKGTV